MKKHLKKNIKNIKINKQQQKDSIKEQLDKAKNNKLIGMIAVLVAFAIGSYNIITSTNLNIQDTNPTSYIIVVMLMIFLFLIFSLKENLEFKFNLKNIIFGSSVFFSYILIISYLRIISSFKFYIYRFDALLLPLFLSSLIIIIFGIGGFKKLKSVIIYSMFASPLILIPLISFNSLFTLINAQIIYHFLRLLQIPVSNSGLVISSLFNHTTTGITISKTCTDIGAFLALIMFLIPISYLFKGKLKNKIIWISSGIILLFIFNIIRMFSIALIWFYYGIVNALILFHALAGPILFYIIIIILILFSYKFKLYIPKINLRYFKIKYDFYLLIPIILILIFGLFNLFFLSNHISQKISPTQFTNYISLNNSLNITLNLETMNNLKYTNKNITQLGAVKLNNITGLSYALKNKTNNAFIFVSLQNNKNFVFNKSNQTFYYVLNDGVSISSYIIKYNNSSIILNEFIKPYKINNNTYIPVDFIILENYNASLLCEFNYNNIGLQNYFESEIFNLIKYHHINKEQILCLGYKIANETD